MRHILRGYTMFVAGIDYGYEIEEIQTALPTEVYVDHVYGGAVMTAQVPMLKIEAMEPTIKFASHNPDIRRLLLRRPGQRDIFTMRAALIDHTDGTIKPDVLIYEGRLTAPEPDAMSREDKSGIGVTIKDVVYFREEIGNETIHEIGLYPAKMVVNRVDLLRDWNDALGRV